MLSASIPLPESVLETTLSRKRRQAILGVAGPLLLCITFIEDGLRVPLRWTEQVYYMTNVMKLWVPSQLAPDAISAERHTAAPSAPLRVAGIVGLDTSCSCSLLEPS